MSDELASKEPVALSDIDAIVSEVKPEYLTDLTDSKYQVDEAFKPDKLELWTDKGSYEKDGWTQAHNAIRGELSTMQGILAFLGRKPLKAWEKDSLKAWWKGHSAHIHDHHGNEDELFMPMMKTRIVLPAKLEEDHTWLVAHMDKIEACINSIRSADELAELWAEYDVKMKAHLVEEEAVCIPLLRAYFTPEEVAAKVQEILGNAPAVAMGSFFFWMGGKGPVMEFMKQEGIPFFVWYIQFKGQLKVYQNEMQKHVTCLMTGWAPKPSSCCC